MAFKYVAHERPKAIKPLDIFVVLQITVLPAFDFIPPLSSRFSNVLGNPPK